MIQHGLHADKCPGLNCGQSVTVPWWVHRTTQNDSGSLCRKVKKLVEPSFQFIGVALVVGEGELSSHATPVLYFGRVDRVDDGAMPVNYWECYPMLVVGVISTRDTGTTATRDPTCIGCFCMPVYTGLLLAPLGNLGLIFPTADSGGCQNKPRQNLTCTVFSRYTPRGQSG